MRHFFFAATLAAALPFPGLPSQFEKIAPAAKGRVGVAAQLLESGETADLHGDEHFPMHTVYKLPISMAVLQRVDRGGDYRGISRDRIGQRTGNIEARLPATKKNVFEIAVKSAPSHLSLKHWRRIFIFISR